MKNILIALLVSLASLSFAQSATKTMLRLPDTGETTSYTTTPGADADYTIYPPFFIDNGNGTVTDTVTGLMWQKADGGEMTVENAAIFCDNLTLGGYTDWRLPNAHEGFSILNHGHTNPALDNTIFTTSTAQYWWSGDHQANDATRIWVTNAGGGIGNHPKSETISAGGTKRFHARAVRETHPPVVLPNRFTDTGDGTIKDHVTGLIWQQIPFSDTLTWEQALGYAENLVLAGQSDWRLPNIKELQSLNDENLFNPSVNPAFFSTIGVKKYWSSTTLPNQTGQAWYLDTRFGITTYRLKTQKNYLLAVRGPQEEAPVAAAHRNVILIIADDLGADYCGFYENHLDTVNMPNIRRLLHRGVVFSNAWSNPICSPTRAGILTGRYSFRTGVGDAVGPGSAVLDTAEITIPRLLNIYAPGSISKANIGKWHLHNQMPATNLLFPNLMGYDHYTGNFNGQLPDYYNWTKVTNSMSAPVTNYATTETANDAISWIKGQGNKPFFVWLAFNAPHTPLHLPPAGLHSFTTLSGTPDDIAANPKLYFKASVEALDHEIGRLFDSLTVYNLWDSTDIIFIGDNGDDPAVAQTNKAKGSIYQGGVTVPFIIAGPSVVNPGRTSDALVNTQDLFATILEMYGDKDWTAHIPANKPVDAKSILPILKNEATQIRPWTFTEVFKDPTVAGDGKAIRNMAFKLLNFDNGNVLFYNLANDPNETTNLLTGGLDMVQATNYNYLCHEMTTLLGTNTFCSSLLPVAGLEQGDKETEAFPNPFSAHIYLSGNVVSELVNPFGQVIFSGKNIEVQDFSGLANGVYFLKIAENGIHIVKMIKS